MEKISESEIAHRIYQDNIPKLSTFSSLRKIRKTKTSPRGEGLKYIRTKKDKCEDHVKPENASYLSKEKE